MKLQVYDQYANNFIVKTNSFFESLGMAQRVDHRSYAERGIDLIPTKHRGPQVNKLDGLGKASRITKRNKEIFEEIIILDFKNFLKYTLLITHPIYQE